jgi:hypothetical protein
MYRRRGPPTKITAGRRLGSAAHRRRAEGTSAHPPSLSFSFISGIHFSYFFKKIFDSSTFTPPNRKKILSLQREFSLSTIYNL